MTIEEIIDGLKFTMEMCLYNPTDGSMRPVSTLNDMDKTTYDACEGAIKLLEQQRWIPVSERLPEKQDCYLVTTKWKGSYSGDVYIETNMAVYREKPKEWDCVDVIAWMPLPSSYQGE